MRLRLSRSVSTAVSALASGLAVVPESSPCDAFHSPANCPDQRAPWDPVEAAEDAFREDVLLQSVRSPCVALGLLVRDPVLGSWDP